MERSFDWVFHTECVFVSKPAEGPQSLLTNTSVISTMLPPSLFILAHMVPAPHTVTGALIHLLALALEVYTHIYNSA